ncbi:hypothetical protein S7335_73 [Synechococcus sp. PCC 7335]|nr:hypothetical protein S7335_73 [Synechococcus sp. PCC 7335]
MLKRPNPLRHSPWHLIPLRRMLLTALTAVLLWVLLNHSLQAGARRIKTGGQIS